MTINTSLLLTSASESNNSKLASKNIKKVLKAKFPKTKFSVRNSTYSSIDVVWKDLPHQADVEALLKPFDIGYSESQSDYFTIHPTDFSDTYGGIQYLFCRQDYSEKVKENVFARLAKHFPTYEDDYDGVCEVSMENYYQGRLMASGFRLLLTETFRAELDGTLTSYESGIEVKKEIEFTPATIACLNPKGYDELIDEFIAFSLMEEMLDESFKKNVTEIYPSKEEWVQSAINRVRNKNLESYIPNLATVDSAVQDIFNKLMKTN